MQINRLFEIVYTLLNKQSITAKELAEHFEVSTRTIYRDVEILSYSGIPIYMSKGRGGGISLLPNFVLNKTLLTEQEKNNLITSLKAMNSLNPENHQGVIQKLSSLFGKSPEDWVEVDFSTWSKSNKENHNFDLAKKATLEKRLLSFDYANAKGEKSMRTIEPLKLCFKNSAWYIYGYCLNKNDMRFFKLSRIKNISLLEEHFVRPVPQKVFQEQTDFYDESVKLKLKISKEMSHRVFDEFEIYKLQDDGSLIAEIDYPVGSWLNQYIFSFGCHCTVLEPEYLKQEIKEELEKTLKNY